MIDQHERIDAVIREVEALAGLPDIREGGNSRIVLALHNLRRLKEFAPRLPGHPARPVDTPRCERGCYVD